MEAISIANPAPGRETDEWSNCQSGHKRFSLSTRSSASQRPSSARRSRLSRPFLPSELVLLHRDELLPDEPRDRGVRGFDSNSSSPDTVVCAHVSAHHSATPPPPAKRGFRLIGARVFFAVARTVRSSRSANGDAFFLLVANSERTVSNVPGSKSHRRRRRRPPPSRDPGRGPPFFCASSPPPPRRAGAHFPRPRARRPRRQPPHAPRGQRPARAFASAVSLAWPLCQSSERRFRSRRSAPVAASPPFAIARARDAPREMLRRVPGPRRRRA